MDPTEIMVLAFSDGTVGRMQYYGDPTDEAIQAAIDKSPFPSGPPLSWKRTELGAFPADPTFRGAWTFAGDAIAVDMEKAVEIHKDALRKVRAPLLQALDIEMMAAWAKGDTKTWLEVEAKKQALRDVTDDPRIAEALTPEDLKAASPEVLLAK